VVGATSSGCFLEVKADDNELLDYRRKTHVYIKEPSQQPRASTPLEHWGSQVKRRRRENRGAVDGEGWSLGRGCAPSQKIYEFFISKWCDMVHSGCVVF